MGYRLSTQTFSFSLLVFAFLCGGNFYVTQGFKHSFKLYFNTTAKGDFFTIETNHPNLDYYSDVLSKVKFACTLGVWGSFTEINYEGNRTGYGSNDGSPYCKSVNLASEKSIRYLGSSESTQDSISLYEKILYAGNEILVTGSAYAGITTPVKSITATGTSEWKLFEGQYLEGKSVCIQVPSPGYYYYYAYTSSLNLITIGSVFKGCNISEIEEYKRNNSI